MKNHAFPLECWYLDSFNLSLMKYPTLTFVYSYPSSRQGVTTSNPIVHRNQRKMEWNISPCPFYSESDERWMRIAINKELHEVCDVDDKGSRNRWYQHQNALLVKNLESLHLALGQSSKASKFVCAVIPGSLPSTRF
jgi:hypothetical protein